MELIRYFSFPYCFFDTKVRRTRYGIWGYESTAGFPSAGDVIKDIDNYLTGKGGLVVTEVRLTGWQEFETENDYRNFTGTKYLDFHEAGAQEREKMLQGK